MDDLPRWKMKGVFERSEKYKDFSMWWKIHRFFKVVLF
jgi:hypothetical protein